MNYYVNMSNFKNNKFDGEYISYYKTGQIKEKGYFRNEKLDGNYIAYYKTGQIKEKATYKNGNIVGKFLSFNEDGSAASGTSFDDSDNTGIWEEKDVADLLQDLKHFDQKNK